MIIAMDKVDSVKVTIDKLIEQGQSLFTDITETAQDRVRLLGEAEQMRQQIADLEVRNNKLASDVIRLETQLNDANARLAAIHETSNSALQDRAEAMEPDAPKALNGKPPNDEVRSRRAGDLDTRFLSDRIRDTGSTPTAMLRPGR